jgi:hypothetical protein
LNLGGGENTPQHKPLRLNPIDMKNHGVIGKSFQMVFHLGTSRKNCPFLEKKLIMLSLDW